MSFVETETGWINTAHVARASQTRDGQYALYDRDDERLGIATGDSWLIAVSSVVPAASGVNVYLLWVDVMHSAPRPVADDVCITLQSVVAWRLMRWHKDVEFAYPILPEPPQLGTAILVPMPEGKLLHCNGGDFPVYDNMEIAEATVLGWAQRDWDRKHAPKAGEAPAR